MSVFMSICTVFLFVSIANLIEAIRHHWSTENKYFAYIGPLIPVGLMLIKFWQNPFAPVNFFIIAIWVVILIVIILLWKKVHLIVDKFFAQEVAKDNVLAKLDPKDVEGSLQYLNEKEREFFLIYEFSDTAILWFGLEEYLTQTSGIHLQEVIDYLPDFNAQEIADQLKWYTKWHNSTPRIFTLINNISNSSIKQERTVKKRIPKDTLKIFIQEFDMKRKRKGKNASGKNIGKWNGR